MLILNIKLLYKTLDDIHLSTSRHFAHSVYAVLALSLIFLVLMKHL